MCRSLRKNREDVNTASQKKIMSRWCQVSPGDGRCRPVTTLPSRVEDRRVVSHQRQHLIVVVVSHSFTSFLRWRKVSRQPPTDWRSFLEEGETERRKGANNSAIRRKASSSVFCVVEDRLRSGMFPQPSAGPWTVDSDERIFATEEFVAVEE